jgi:hypothetical protein
MLLNIQHAANWHAIKHRKQLRIIQNNQRENSKRLPHTYKIGDKVLLERHNQNKYERPYDGPFEIVGFHPHTTGTVRLRMGSVTDFVNIRRLHPFTTPDSTRGAACNMRRAKRRRTV